MTTLTPIPKYIEEVLAKQNGATSSRRDFLKTSGLLVVSLGVPAIAGPHAAAAQAAGPYPDPDFRQLDSWIVIHEDNTATFFVGKTDCGQGTGTAFRQMMADELDIAYDKTACVMGSTDVTVDQGGSGGSDAIQTDGWPMRRVARGCGPVFRPRFQATRFVDRRPRKQHRNFLCRQDRLRSGHWHILPPADGR